MEPKSAIKYASDLLDYFDATRGCGHTASMVKGESTVLTHTAEFAKSLSDMYEVDALTINNLILLMGKHTPIVLDNYLLQQILSGLLMHINILNHTAKYNAELMEEIHNVLSRVR